MRHIVVTLACVLLIGGCSTVRKFLGNQDVQTIAPLLTTASCAQLKAKGNAADVANVQKALAACQAGLK